MRRSTRRKLKVYAVDAAMILLLVNRTRRERMIHLRLCKGLSYLGTVRATKAEPDVYVSEEKAKDLVDMP